VHSVLKTELLIAVRPSFLKRFLVKQEFCVVALPARPIERFWAQKTGIRKGN
jgi:hypothetical protein